jgi:hypothetical protein
LRHDVHECRCGAVILAGDSTDYDEYLADTHDGYEAGWP